MSDSDESRWSPAKLQPSQADRAAHDAGSSCHFSGVAESERLEVPEWDRMPIGTEVQMPSGNGQNAEPIDSASAPRGCSFTDVCRLTEAVCQRHLPGVASLTPPSLPPLPPR